MEQSVINPFIHTLIVIITKPSMTHRSIQQKAPTASSSSNRRFAYSSIAPSKELKDESCIVVGWGPLSLLLFVVERDNLHLDEIYEMGVRYEDLVVRKADRRWCRRTWPSLPLCFLSLSLPLSPCCAVPCCADWALKFSPSLSLSLLCLVRASLDLGERCCGNSNLSLRYGVRICNLLSGPHQISFRAESCFDQTYVERKKKKKDWACA